MSGAAALVRQEQTSLHWLFPWDTVQAPGRPGSRSGRLLLLFCFGEGPEPPSAASRPPHVGAATEQSIFR